MASPTDDVIVIGAGLAGLQAAAILVAAGRRVTVLEARDRVGGRVWSHRFGNGQWCERGAEFIDATHEHVLALAASAGLALTRVRAGRDPSRKLVDLAGRATAFDLHHSLAGDLGRWSAALAELAAEVDPNDPAGGGAAALDAATVGDLLHELDVGVLARVVIGRDIRTEFMLAPDEVSQLMVAWMTARHLQAGDGREAFRIDGGNDQLAASLAARIAGSIRLGMPAALIDADAGAVILASGERLVADDVVATVPLPVLGRLWAAMPAPLAQVSYGIGGKVSVQFERRIWHDEGYDGSVVSDRPWGELWETTDDQPGDSGVLTALLSSHDGAALAALPDTADRVVAEADRLFRGLKALAGERVQTDWTNDPFSLGGYATFGPRQLVAAWPLLRQRHGRLLLAGEHTDTFSGYMEGALRSGQRVAAEVLGAR